MDQLKAAVIGCGGHAQSHLRMIADEPRLHLAAIAEMDEDRLENAKAKYRPDHAFDDYQEMIEAVDLDVVYVVTLPGHLMPIVITCLEEGLNVSVEKSPGMTSEDTEMMAEAARDASGKAIVSFNRRYFPEVLAVRRLVSEHGGAVHVGATYNKPLTTLGTLSAADLNPDPIISDAIHHVDLLRWLAGANEDRAAIPVAVHAEVEDGERPGAHRHNATIRFDSGAIGVLMSHYGVGSRIQRTEVHAEDLSAYLEMTQKPQVELYTATEAKDGTTTGKQVKSGLDLKAVGGPRFNETAHFVDCIINDREPWSTLDDAVHTMRLCEAIRRGHKGDLT